MVSEEAMGVLLMSANRGGQLLNYMLADVVSYNWRSWCSRLSEQIVGLQGVSWARQKKKEERSHGCSMFQTTLT